MDSRDLTGASTPFVELNDLKRVTSAARAGSIATRLFRDAWASLLAGAGAAEAAWSITGRALAAARLGDIDRAALEAAGLAAEDAAAVLHAAASAVAAPFGDDVRRRACDGLAAARPTPGDAVPAFVDALAAQPRAGLTRPGRPRIVLEPPENHADHCLVVAVYGVLLSRLYAADAGTVFVAALAHHLHNAGLPDAGFAGETLLGAHLDRVIAHHVRASLLELPPEVRRLVERARAVLPDVETAEGRAFHAADVIDRVLQILQYRRAGALTTDLVLGEMELVHAGPVKTFQDEVLRRTGLA